ncbi:MAG: hypothetical protein ACFCA4_16030 [Cyanophyceae cyanobacterium]
MAIAITIGGLVTSLILLVSVVFSWAVVPEAYLSEVTEGKIKSPKNWKTYTALFSILSIIIAGPIATAWWVASAYDASFYERLLAAWLVMVMINIMDLIVIDIVIYMWIYPSWMRIEGVEPLHKYRPHVEGAITGCSTIGVPIALIAAGITTFV